VPPATTLSLRPFDESNLSSEELCAKGML